MVKSYLRGHEIYYNNKDKQWYYLDDNSIADDSRPCKKCGKYPTKEGYDACIGYLEGVKSACCGHGVQEDFIIKED